MKRQFGTRGEARTWTQTLQTGKKGTSGFTIVELLIVVIVIAILATIAIFGFRGVSANAKESALKADLRSAATQLGVTKEESGSYPGSDAGLKKSNETVFAYTSGGNTFCLQASREDLVGKSFYITQDGSLQQGECPVAPLATMQSFTTAQCAALPVFNGSNASAIRTLADNRGGTTRNYEVAKLADNKCWMLTNLKLGSTSGPITLTPADSNVASSFTLPQLNASSTSSQDDPTASGPVTGDTGAGATNYGYLYNWSAATAGATTSSNPAGSGDALNSICPTSWRLPSGGASGGDVGLLNAKMNNPSATSPSVAWGAGYDENWRFSGPFRGVYSGSWYGGTYFVQSADGGFWTGSASTRANRAYSFHVNTGYIYPGNNDPNRGSGLALRCVLS